MYFGTANISSSKENGDLVYTYTAVFEIDSNWLPCYGEVKVVPGSISIYKRKLRIQRFEVEDLEEETVRPHLKPIPFSKVYPLCPGTFLQAQDTVFQNCHIKSLDLGNYIANRDFSAPANIKNITHSDTNPLLAEAIIYEAFRKSPQPNILQYEGCVVRDGRVVALAFPGLYETLAERIEDGTRPIIAKKIHSEISAAMHHLHSLGFAHNDINPWNIMLKEDGTAVLIDFDACAKEREPLFKSILDRFWSVFTPFSDQRKDLHSLKRLEQYLNDPLHRQQDTES